MMTGQVKRLVQDKGFGFIKVSSGGGGEYFFHRSSCEQEWDQLKEGTRVSFEPVSSQKGLRAEDVRIQS